MIFNLLILFVVNIAFCQGVLSERYTTFSELEDKISDWNLEFSNNENPYSQVNGEGIIFHHEIIGYTGVDNLPIWAIKLSFNANVDEDEPKVLILGQCHAEEIYGLEIAVELIEWLLYPTNDYAQSIYSVMSSSEIWIIPTHNPEGLNVVHGWYDDTNQWRQDESYRKNKYDANQNNMFDYFYGIGDDVDGVDLNRNYDFNWIFGDDFQQVDTGCSANPSYLSNFDYYRGPYPFSEPEIQAIKDFTLENNFLLSIAYHSSRSGCVAEKVISPWLWDGGKAAPDLDIISRLGEEIAYKTPSWDGQSFYYPANSTSRRGNAHDWLYSQTGCIQYLIEVGTSDMQSSDVALIETTIDNNMQGLFHLLKRAAGTNIQDGPDKYQITGLVLDDNGEPITAEVKILELDGPMLEPRYTDNFGRYRRLLIEGTYTLEITADGYEPYYYEFVPSSSSITHHNVTLNKLPEYSIEFNISYPINFNESSTFIFENSFHSDTLLVNNINNEYNLLVGPTLFSEGEHTLKIFSENLFPEIIPLQILSDSLINVDLKWKGVLFNDDFNNSNNWLEQGDWNIDNGQLISQSSLLYNNSINNVITTNNSFSDNEMLNDYILEVDLKQELEWDNDKIAFYFSCNGCVNDTLLTLSDQSWYMKKYHKTFEFLNNNLNFNVSISSDSTLNYRGAQLNKLSLLFKPSEDCFKGDLDLDGSVDISDIILMVNIIFELINTEGFLFCVSDMNSNQIININDIVLVVEKILYN